VDGARKIEISDVGPTNSQKFGVFTSKYAVAENTHGHDLSVVVVPNKFMTVVDYPSGTFRETTSGVTPSLRKILGQWTSPNSCPRGAVAS
jgi:hypothetical protein